MQTLVYYCAGGPVLCVFGESTFEQRLGLCLCCLSSSLGSPGARLVWVSGSILSGVFRNTNTAPVSFLSPSPYHCTILESLFACSLGISSNLKIVAPESNKQTKLDCVCTSSRGLAAPKIAEATKIKCASTAQRAEKKTVKKKVSNSNPLVRSNLVTYTSRNTNSIPKQLERCSHRTQDKFAIVSMASAARHTQNVRADAY